MHKQQTKSLEVLFPKWLNAQGRTDLRILKLDSLRLGPNKWLFRPTQITSFDPICVPEQWLTWLDYFESGFVTRNGQTEGWNVVLGLKCCTSVLPWILASDPVCSRMPYVFAHFLVGCIPPMQLSFYHPFPIPFPPPPLATPTYALIFASFLLSSLCHVPFISCEYMIMMDTS